MAQSTTVQNAVDLVVTHGGTNVSGSLQSASLTVTRENAQHFTAKGDWAFALVGKRKGSGTFTGYYSETAGEFYATMVASFEAGTSASLVLSPMGNASGEEAQTVSVFITSMPYTFDSATANAIMLAVPFVTTGALTRADVA